MTRIWNKHKQPFDYAQGKTNTPLKKKVLVAMSGGVDSSVAAKLLKDQGHDVVGIFLRFWKDDYEGSAGFDLSAEASAKAENKCCSIEDLSDAKRVADKIGMPFYVLDYSKIFKKQVVDNFLDEYGRGKTPNPCVRCNKLVKLGFLINQAKVLGFDYVASGHYARLRREFTNPNDQFSKKTNNNFFYKLYKAKDKNKDQSYFLYRLNQAELKHLLFPLGNYTKPRVRQLAKKFKLPVAEKRESQEICFIREKNHNEFLKRRLKLIPGPIKTFAGRTIGEHEGLPLYTVGQRKGIKIGGIGPFYAAKMNYKKNSLYVVSRSDHPMISRRELTAKNINWLAGEEPSLPLTCRAAIRYGGRAAKAAVFSLNKNNYKVKFFEPPRAIAPGQSVVFYQGEEVLGGGVIS